MDTESNSGQTVEILIVDDEEEIRGVLRDMISFFGYQPSAFGSAEDAIVTLDSHDYKLALIDVILPGISGLEFAKELHLTKPDMKIVLTGGYDKYVEKDEMDNLGVDSFVPKPFKMDEIRRILKELL